MCAIWRLKHVKSKPTRREVIGGALAATGASMFGGSPTFDVAFASEDQGSITDVAGIKVGHFTDSRRPTGCTVVLTEEGATAGVDVRGAAPGTRETDLLSPTNTVEMVHAIVLAGGSAFGLDAASGVMKYLDEKHIGFHVGNVV